MFSSKKARLFLLALSFMSLALTTAARSISPVNSLTSDRQIIEQLALEQLERFEMRTSACETHFEIGELRQSDDWAFFTLICWPQTQTDPHVLVPSVIVFALAHKDVAGWHVYLEFDETYRQLLNDVPETLLSYESKQALLNTQPGLDDVQNPQAPTATTGLPWQPGTTWYYRTSIHGGNNALDLASPCGTVGQIRAADSGTVVWAYETCILVRRSDGLEIGYQHVDAGDIANWSVGDPVANSQYLGDTTMANGCSGYSEAHHVHFWLEGVNPNGSTFGGWTLNDPYLNKGSESRYPNLGCIDSGSSRNDLLYDGTGICCGCGTQTPVYDTAFLTDAELTAYNSMSAQDIRNFLTAHNSYFKGPVVDVDGVTFDMADVMAQAAVTHQISPKVLLATLQKESSSVTTSTRPSNMGWIMGYGSPSTARDQVDAAAGAFRWYQNTIISTGQTPTGWQVGVEKQTLDGVMVTPATNAVAGQFTYTPHAGEGWGGAAGGVHLFYQIWNDFGFGSGLSDTTTSLQLTLPGPDFPNVDNYAYTPIPSQDEPRNDNFIVVEDAAPHWTSAMPAMITTDKASPLSLTWPDAVDENGRITGYFTYWGNDPHGENDIFTTETTFTPSETVPAGVPATRYLRVAAQDDSGNMSEWQTMAVWQYDPTAPTGSFTVGAGGSEVRSLNATLNLAVQDTGSQVTDMRFSEDGRSWTAWEPFAPTRRWQLDNTDSRQTVYAQVKDAAGNVSEIMEASATAVLNIEPPSSTNYQLRCSVFGMGGGTKSSSSYTVYSTTGQPHTTGNLQSGSYQVHSGFWSGCGAPTAPPMEPDNWIYLPTIIK